MLLALTLHSRWLLFAQALSLNRVYATLLQTLKLRLREQNLQEVALQQPQHLPPQHRRRLPFEQPPTMSYRCNLQTAQNPLITPYATLLHMIFCSVILCGWNYCHNLQPNVVYIAHTLVLKAEVYCPCTLGWNAAIARLRAYG